MNVFDYVYYFETQNGKTGIVRADNIIDAENRVANKYCRDELKYIKCCNLLEESDYDFGIVDFTTEINTQKYKLVDIEYVDMGHFQMYEGKFQDMEQWKYQNKEVYIYANLSNNEYDFEDEENYIRAYPYPFKDLYCAENYELVINNPSADYIKYLILKEIRKETAT